MSTLADAVPALFVLGLVLRYVVSHDRAVSRLFLSLVAVIGDGPRARRAVRLLQMYLRSSD